MDWTEQRTGTTRKLICLRPSGYEGNIVVAGNELSARLWKLHEQRDSFTLPPHRLPRHEIESAVKRIQAEIESRLEVLEDGHS